MALPAQLSEENKQRKLERQLEKSKPLKKELKVFVKPNTALYSVAFTSGGELPKQLQGSWNSRALAERAIDIYKINRQTGTR